MRNCVISQRYQHAFLHISSPNPQLHGPMVILFWLQRLVTYVFPVHGFSVKPYAPSFEVSLPFLSVKPSRFGSVHVHLYLVGGFNLSQKYESQLGLLFPIYGKIKAMFQTTNQKSSETSLSLTRTPAMIRSSCCCRAACAGCGCNPLRHMLQTYDMSHFM